MDVYEQREDIGGVLLPAAAPDFKEELRHMIPWWRTQLDALDTVTVHVGEAIAADDPRLAEAGHEVVIVEMADEIASDMLMLNRISLLPSHADAGVRILTGTTVTAIGGTACTSRDTTGLRCSKPTR